MIESFRKAINDVISIALGVKNEPEAVVKDELEPCPEIKEEPFSHNQSQDGTSPDDEVFADFLSQFYKWQEIPIL